MEKIAAAILLVLSSFAVAGPYPPAAGQPGSTAIHKDNPAFVAWATGCTVVRGLQKIDEPGYGYVSYGTEADALGKATGDSFGVVTLGDNGSATLTFDHPICNGTGYDFAVFENGMSDTFLELGFVEVSSNGTDFFRFPSVSVTQTTTQVEGFGNLDPTNIHNLAGKYRQGYGTPFDLEELKNISPLLNVNAVTHVRIIDVVGCIQDAYARYDSQGHKINDPWSTPFEKGGFDLDAVGVIHQAAFATVTGTVSYTPYEGPGYLLTIATLKLVQNGTVLDSQTLDFNGSGTDPKPYTFTTTATGSAQVIIDQNFQTGWYGKTQNITLVAGSTVNENLALTHAGIGDANMDDMCDDSDVDILNGCYGITDGTAVWCIGDFDGDGNVYDSDVDILNGCYGLGVE